jgi:sugar phosphate isomerase/epimerase
MLGGSNVEENLARAAGDGAEIVQIWCTKGDLAPETFTPAFGQRLLNRAQRLGVTISALCGDTGLGFTNPETIQKNIDLTTGFFKVARVLNVPIVTSHIGYFTDAKNPNGRQTGLEGLKRLGEIAERHGVTFASETGGEDGPVLREFLDDLAQPRIKVNFDPANMLMRGFCLPTAVRLLGPHIVHSHAKDALAKGGEKPIGAGDVPWPCYLGWLKAAGYTGALAIEREGGNTWWEDCRQGIHLIKKWRA